MPLFIFAKLILPYLDARKQLLVLCVILLK